MALRLRGVDPAAGTACVALLHCCASSGAPSDPPNLAALLLAHCRPRRDPKLAFTFHQTRVSDRVAGIKERVGRTPHGTVVRTCTHVCAVPVAHPQRYDALICAAVRAEATSVPDSIWSKTGVTARLAAPFAPTEQEVHTYQLELGDDLDGRRDGRLLCIQVTLRRVSTIARVALRCPPASASVPSSGIALPEVVRNVAVDHDVRELRVQASCERRDAHAPSAVVKWEASRDVLAVDAELAKDASLPAFCVVNGFADGAAEPPVPQEPSVEGDHAQWRVNPARQWLVNRAQFHGAGPDGSPEAAHIVRAFSLAAARERLLNAGELLAELKRGIAAADDGWLSLRRGPGVWAPPAWGLLLGEWAASSFFM